MSLPPGFLDELRNRVPISRVIGPRVVWDQRKSNQARGDWWAPCPFHQEKSASFHCDDQKGFYYCFGCHAKGDAIGFLRELDGLEFMDAVKVLATEAGMTVPAPDPKARERQDKRATLFEVTEAANRWFRLQLQTAPASEARDYLERRGLDAAALDQFEIGFAPDSRNALSTALREKGIDEAQILEAGISARPDDGRPAYDRFRDRIIFPIRDGRDRVIGFGGRAMAADARAKYLNSPETPLFDKGRNLYNLGPARAAVSKGAPLLVAEGYMDVIALVRAGFAGAVAPLGTAITEAQLQLMWRVAPEPVIMLDGDAAGQRAAMRLIDLALPMTGPGQALRFAMMPPGQDPDDLIAAEGAGAMAAIIDAARPLVDLLWSRETEGKVFDSPERRAALDHALRAAIGQIPDESTRAHYAAEIKNKRAELFGGQRREQSWGRGPREAGKWPQGSRGVRVAEPALAQTRALAMAMRDGGDALLEGAVLMICAEHPELVEGAEARLEKLLPQDPARAALIHDLLAGTESAMGREALQALRNDAQIQSFTWTRQRKEFEAPGTILSNALDRLEARRVAQLENARAEVEIAGEADEGLTWRMTQITRARQRADNPLIEDASDLGENSDALRTEVEGWLQQEIWRKKPN